MFNTSSVLAVPGMFKHRQKRVNILPSVSELPGFANQTELSLYLKASRTVAWL